MDCQTPKGINGHRSGFIYAIFRENDSAIKLGYSINPNSRLSGVRCYKQNGVVKMMATVRVNCMACSEKSVHDRFKSSRLPSNIWAGKEWFTVTADEAMAALSEVCDSGASE